MPTEAIADSIDIEELYDFVMALRNGDFAKRLTVPQRGRAKEVAMHLNRHIEQMERTLSEVTRVAREVGVEGKLGPQAEVAVVNGPYKQMVDAVNVLSGTVTDNVRDLIWTLDAMNEENRPRKVHENAQGEWLKLKAAMNRMVERASAAPAAER